MKKMIPIRFRWPSEGRGYGKRKFSCYVEPIETFSTLTAKHGGDSTSDCSNGVVEMEIKVFGNKNPSGHGQGGVVFDAEGIPSALNVAKCTPPNVAVRAVLTPDREEKRQNGRRMKDEGEPMFTLTAQDRHGVAICPSLKIKEATAKGYAEAKVGDGVNLSNPSSNTRRGRVGDGVVNTLTCDNQMGVVVNDLPLAYDKQNENLRRDGTVGTLTTDESSPKHNNRVIVGDHQVRIRRLTPRECWRLQGFPDEYFYKARAAGISDTQLYKMAGNAVTVNVAYAIGKRLKEIEDEEEGSRLL